MSYKINTKCILSGYSPKNGEIEGVETINEKTAEATGDFVAVGCELMKEFLEA